MIPGAELQLNDINVSMSYCNEWKKWKIVKKNIPKEELQISKSFKKEYFPFRSFRSFWNFPTTLFSKILSLDFFFV